MEFEQWWESHVGITVWASEEFSAKRAWEASKAEERERCALIAEQYTGSKKSPLHSTVSLIAEQIRKGE